MYGDSQGASGSPSTAHTKVDPGSLAVNSRVGRESRARSGGPDVIVVSGGMKSKISSAPMSGWGPCTRGSPSMSAEPSRASEVPASIVGEAMSWLKTPSAGLARTGSAVWFEPLPGSVTAAVPAPVSEGTRKLELVSAATAAEPAPAFAATSTAAPERIALRASSTRAAPPDAETRRPADPGAVA